LLLAGFVLATLYALGVRTLVPPDEGRYAEIGREMFASGDWITTRLNGIKYFEKPPLQAWMNALTFTLFGLGEWQARLWTGVCGIVGVVMTAWAGRVVFSPRVGLYAGLVLASSLFWLAAGQINSLDMSLAAMMSLSLGSVLIAQRDAAGAAERRAWMLAAWAAMALAVLAKGLVGIVLPGAVLVLYSLAARDADIWRRLHLGKGLLVFFAIAAPWFILVGLRNPEQPHFFFIHEHFERFLTTGHRREGAWWYFVPLLLAGVLPWLGLLPHGLAAGLKRQPGRFQPRLLLLIWAVFIVVFFSSSSSKLPGYIVPVFPALALLMAVYLEAAGRRPQLWTAGLAALSGALLAGGVAVAVAKGHGGVQLSEYQPWLLCAGAILLAGGIAGWRADARGSAGRAPASDIQPVAGGKAMSVSSVLPLPVGAAGRPELSIVIPVYNEQDTLPRLFARLYPALDALGSSYEIVFVNDGSRDASVTLLADQFRRRPDVTRVVLFNGNYGQHMAILAGFQSARGEIVVTLDADLQNPPEEIGKLVAKIREGHDYVGSIRRVRQDSAWRTLASKAMNRMRERITNIRITDQGNMLRAYGRNVINLVNQCAEVNTFVPALAYTFARYPTEVSVELEERAAGAS
jgi:4-amino-4-deoxy-L-arabinose transferase-like glycosyltransferase